MQSKRLASVLIGAVLVSTGLAAAAAPASAVACKYTAYNNTTKNYARTTDASGGCSKVGAAHYFLPGGAGTLFTGWVYGGDVAQTGSARELSHSKHSGS